MDAKMRANFINSISTDDNSNNNADNTLPNEGKNKLKSEASQAVNTDDDNEKNVWANGLPRWSLEPPRVVVRRKAKK